MAELIRCDWSIKTDIERDYHDKEWGVPVHDDRKHFEFLLLDAFQAGLSWATILKKRENFRIAFDDFDPEKIARYDQNKFNELINNAGIIRNKLKIESAIDNAKAFLELKDKIGSFDKFIWKFTDGKTKVNHWKNMSDVPPSTPESSQMSKELKKFGFRFVGTTICYAYMQAAGMVNDHLESCFRYQEINGIL